MPVPEDQHERLYTTYLEGLRARYPGFKVIKKGQSRFNRVIDVFLKAITFGRQSSYLGGYVTTFGQRIYVPDDWDEMSAGYRYCTMRHEAVHIRQFERLTWPGMAALYLLFPLPVVFSGRRFIELPAYRESLTATWQVYGEDAARSDSEVSRIVAQFTGPSYAWMWVHGTSIEAALRRHLDSLSASPPPDLAHSQGS